MMKTFAFAAIAALIPLGALAHDGMAVKDAYVRSTNPKSASAFMRIENHRAVDCTLTGVASAAAERAELHTNREEGGVMKMLPVEAITIPAGQTHALDRGGDHVMFMGLTRPLAEGESVALTLDFGECGRVEVEAPVDNARQPDGANPAPAAHPAHAGH